MRGLQVMTGFTLYPDRALIEITGKVLTAMPHHGISCGGPIRQSKVAMRIRASSLLM